jgi:hypothetical protein
MIWILLYGVCWLKVEPWCVPFLSFCCSFFFFRLLLSKVVFCSWALFVDCIICCYGLQAFCNKSYLILCMGHPIPCPAHLLLILKPNKKLKYWWPKLSLLRNKWDIFAFFSFFLRKISYIWSLLSFRIIIHLFFLVGISVATSKGHYTLKYPFEWLNFSFNNLTLI